jgi:hypothetical protein
VANAFAADVLIQAPDPKEAARHYVECLGFAVDAETPELISLHGPAINLYIERGPALGPVLEVMVDDVEAARQRLLAAGGAVIKDEPDVPRTYVRDAFGLTYNLRRGP